MKVGVIGAGPAGLSTAYLLSKNKINTTVFEKDNFVGGISRTIVKGEYRFDLGGHRFFSKNIEINQFLEEVVGDELIDVGRKSRIYFNKKYFDYPLTPKNAVFSLGIPTAIDILTSYITQRIKRIVLRKEIITLEDWVTDKFGSKMFKLYFKSYTEKVWGIPCNKIEAEWVAQRIKGMSLSKAVKSAFTRAKSEGPATLLREFMYPKLGIGRISERMTDSILKSNNKVLLNSGITGINISDNKILSLKYCSEEGKRAAFEADQFVSSMPITELLDCLNPSAPKEVINAAKQLKFRDFIAVTLMLNKESVTDDTWLYIHEPNIQFGRIHEPKNWSSDMSPPGKTSLVMEYFCFEVDDIWKKPDSELIELTQNELIEKLRFISEDNILDSCVVRVKKAYPMYDLGYKKHLTVVLGYLNKFKNLHLIGRNGTFRYNNMDHSIEMGIKAARKILGSDEDIFSVNSSDEYLEEASD